MESIFEKLENISRNSEDSISKLVSTKILELFLKGDFKSQEDLANECFVSLSTITKFAQKIGYSGYRELIFLLKTKRNIYLNENEENAEPLKKFEAIQKWIMQNDEFINELAECILKSKKINVFSSYQVKHSVVF